MGDDERSAMVWKWCIRIVIIEMLIIGIIMYKVAMAEGGSGV